MPLVVLFLFYATSNANGSVMDFKCLLLRVQVGASGCLQTPVDKRTHRIQEEWRGCSIQVTEPRSSKQDLQKLTMSIAVKILNMGEKKTCHIISGNDIMKPIDHSNITILYITQHIHGNSTCKSR